MVVRWRQAELVQGHQNAHCVSSILGWGAVKKQRRGAQHIPLLCFFDWKLQNSRINSDFPDVKKIGWFFSCFIPYKIRHITAVKKKVKTGGKNVNYPRPR